MIQQKSINELAQIVRGVSYKPEDLSDSTTPNYVPLLRAMNISDGILNYKDLVYVNPKRISKIQKLKDGDVVIAASTGSKKMIGKAAQVSNNWDGSFGVFCMVLRPKTDLVDSKYFGYYFQSDYYRKTISHMSSGANINNLKKEYFDRLQILLPPLDNQKQIAYHLEQSNELIRKRRQAIDLLEEYTKSCFFEMFGDPKTNPNQFPLMKLKELYIDSKNGTKCGPFGSALKKSELVDEGIPVWNMDNISLSGKMVMPFRMWITSQKYQELKSYSVLNNDVIISRAGTVGKMCVANTNEESIISTNLIRVRFGNKLLPLYFVSLMNYCKGRVGRLKTGPDGSFTHMNTGVLDDLIFPLPPIELQSKFAEIVQETEDLKQKMLRQLRELDNQFQSLMQSSFHLNNYEN